MDEADEFDVMMEEKVGPDVIDQSKQIGSRNVVEEETEEEILEGGKTLEQVSEEVP